MKSTLKRESKELEVVEREAIVTSDGSRVIGAGGNLSKRADQGVALTGHPRKRGWPCSASFPFVHIKRTSWHELSRYDTRLGE